jgi:putative transposase
VKTGRFKVAEHLQSTFRISQRRACTVTIQHRSTQRYRSCKPTYEPLRSRIKEIAAARVRYGYRRIQVLLRREGHQAGKHLVYRLYREEGLRLRTYAPKRRKMAVSRQQRFKPNAANQAWSLDFVSDQLANGMRFRALTVVDIFTRESLAIDVGQRLRGEDVVATLGRLQQQRGAPTYLFCDNGGEFSGRILDLWAYHHRVRIDFSRPGKPTDNAYVESFNGRLRDECLNTHWFESINEAKQ